MTPTEEQEQALETIKIWYYKTHDQKVFKLGGLAGTGKSSLIAWIPDFLGISVDSVQFVAPTNKAALVVQGRLELSGIKTNVRTIHKTYYNKRESHCSNCPLSDHENNICHGVSGHNKCGCFLDFHAHLKENNKISLIICDESSMVGRQVYNDVLSTSGEHIKLLFVGDHGQLEAVEDDDAKKLGRFFLMQYPDFILREIQRQAKDSPIIQLAHKARFGFSIPFGEFGLGVIKIERADELDIDISLDPIAITYFANVDRSNHMHKGRLSVNELNKIWRANLGIDSSRPIIGDKVICKDYIRSQSIPKGTLGVIRNIQLAGKNDTIVGDNGYYAEIVLNDGRLYEGMISSNQFFSNKQIWGQNHLHKWDYGYAITCHSAQGSEFDSVVVFEPPVGFIRWLGKVTYSKWLYTAITRAKKQLTLVG